METEKQEQPKSLRERIMPRGSLREKLAGVAVAGVGSVIRSTDTVSKGLEMVANKPPKPKTDIGPEQNQMEQEQSNQALRMSGFATNEDGSKGDRLPLKERLQLAVENPTTARNLLSESELELVDILEPEEANWLEKVKQRVTGKQSEPTVALKQDGLGEEVQITTRSESDKVTNSNAAAIKRTPDFYPPEVRQQLATTAKEYKFDAGRLSAQLESEMGWFDPAYVKEDEGAIGLGQHRDIFFKEWNPKFKQKYGRDYDRTNPEDTFKVTALAMSTLTKQFGSWEAALIAYNKGASVVKQYQDDPKYTFDDDPYVKGVKAKLKKYE